MSVLPPPGRRTAGSTVPPGPVLRAGTDLRLLRAALFTTVCVLLSAAGHGLASCAPVPLWTLGAGGVAVFVVVMASAGRERSLPAIAAGLALGQLGLHALFSLGQHGTATTGRIVAGADGRVVALAEKMVCNSGPGGLSYPEALRIVRTAGIDPATNPALVAHGGTGGAAGGAMDGPAWFGRALATPHSSWPGSLLPSPAMLLAHLFAALVAGWLLRRGEAALWRLVRLSLEGVCVRPLRAALRLVRLLYAGLTTRTATAPGPVRRRDAPDGPAPGALVLQHSVIRRGPPRYALAA
ncbi:hypothetical protein IHE55_14120 [Streptomyces pactum]|uniref:Integral membrane protein n=1 Tax=Streptomyces pactum TaxID=68249 RepID=A0ABS0NKY5_9ACTN|nr:hypothetical protein [Streptomyces pactum]MBH5335861.1 hypothetical protein [Streptomyces pactum]